MSNRTIKEIREYLDGVEQFKNITEVQADTWYKSNLNEAKLTTAEKKKRQRDSVKKHKVSRPEPGRMYQFGYNAKNAKKLKYWDKYPLMICLGVTGKHFMGVNLHYVPPKQRAEFLDTIMRYSSTKTVSNNTYLKISYNKIKRHKWVGHMLKNYLFTQVVEVFEEIAPKDWGKAIKLPTQQFTYKDSDRNISATAAYNDRNKK